MSATLQERILREHAAAEGALSAPARGRESRHRAIQELGARGLPSSRDENWKYANLRPLERARFAPAAAAAAIEATQLPAPLPGFTRWVFVDGRRSAALSSGPAPHGIVMQPGGPSEPVSLSGDARSDSRFALLNEAFAVDGAELQIGAAAEAKLEVLFIAVTSGEAGASYPQLALQAAPDARVTLIERHLCLESDAPFVNAFARVDIAARASVCHYRLQQGAARSSWYDTLTSRIARDASYELCNITLGGGATRSTLLLQLEGAAASARLAAVAVADGHQVQDTYARIEHLAARGRSEQLFRGIAGGRSRVGFNGKVVVGAQAIGTHSEQSLRGLLAGDQAEVDVRPQLEIHTDEVRCSHGATVGKLDDNMLFYMLARGLERSTAQQLLKWAFLEDVVARITVPALRREIEQRIAANLAERDTLKEFV